MSCASGAMPENWVPSEKVPFFPTAIPLTCVPCFDVLDYVSEVFVT